MREWTYTWHSSDGLRHEARMAAPSKDDVYAALRKQGIRAIKVTECVTPVVRRGLRGLRKRDWALIVLCALCLVLCAILLTRRGDIPVAPVDAASSPRQNKTQPSTVPLLSPPTLSTPTNSSLPTSHSSLLTSHSSLLTSPSPSPAYARPRPRRTLGVTFDAASLAAAFAHPSEAYLARFAQPGEAVKPPPFTPALADDLMDALDDTVSLSPDDPKELVELKQVVAGLKEEARLFLKTGKTAADFAAWLAARQRMEADYRAHILAGMDGTDASRAEANRQLRSLGFAPTPE